MLLGARQFFMGGGGSPPTPTTIAQIQAAIRWYGTDDAAARAALVGVEIPDEYTLDNGTKRSDPLICVDTKFYVDANGDTRLVAKMMRKLLSPYTIQYDAPENGAVADEATEPTALAGLYYYGFNGSSYTALNLSTGAAIPYANWQRINKNSVNKVDVLRYGWAFWADSAWRQYLNADTTANTWWQSKHLGDTKPSFAATRNGYMMGCSSDLLAAVRPVQHSTRLYPTNTTTTDTFWIPTSANLYMGTNGGDGTYDEYWRVRTGLSAPSSRANAGRAYSVGNQLRSQTSTSSVGIPDVMYTSGALGAAAAGAGASLNAIIYCAIM